MRNDILLLCVFVVAINSVWWPDHAVTSSTQPWVTIDNPDGSKETCLLQVNLDGPDHYKSPTWRFNLDGEAKQTVWPWLVDVRGLLPGKYTATTFLISNGTKDTLVQSDIIEVT